MRYLNGSAVYNVDLYTHLDILHGEVLCPSGIRLTDVFNRTGNARNDFIEFIDEGQAEQNRQRSYIRKDSILLLAVSEENQGRGVGANENFTSFPFVSKNTRSAILQLQNYNVLGSLHLCQGQTSQDLLNGVNQFIPLTCATIQTEQREFGMWPFVIVNKSHLVRLWDQQAGRIPEPVLA
jgi:hypothetical protein